MSKDRVKTKIDKVQILTDCLITAGILLCALALCSLLHRGEESMTAAYMIFVLAVLFVSRLTEGYAYGVIASFIAVFSVNYIFTYPFLEFNFTITGYPLTFATMLLVAILTSTTTTQIKQEEHLKAENEKERVRANLLRAVSHDIRTPLTSIVGSTSVLLEEGCTLDDAEKRQLLEDIRDDSSWLIRTAENILSITRIGDDGQGEAAIEKTPEIPEEIIEAAIRKFRKHDPSADISINVSLPEEVMLVPMDAILIEQLISNILENAVDHGKTVRNIDISLCREDDYSVIYINNDGKAIPKENLSTLFNGSSTAGEKNESDKKRSMGLGLSVCRAIAKAHGGTLSVQNITDYKGVSFRLALPFAEEETNENQGQDSCS